MLYDILKPLSNIFLRIYYTIEVKGINNVPHNKPVILAPNHTNGFVDPVLVAMMLKPKVRFFARGDAFKGRFVKWALNDMHMSPIYRTQDGYSDVKKNDSTFEECKTLLFANKPLLMFPEGVAIQEKRLQHLKKGLARIAFQTEEVVDFKKNVIVMPIGLNYSDAKKFRSKVFIHYGDPISLKKSEDRYRQDKVHTINDFTATLERSMRNLIITINNKANDRLVEGIYEIYLQQWMNEKKYDLKSVEKEFKARREIVEMVNYLDPINPEMIESIKKKIKPYLKQLDHHLLRDHLLRPETITNTKGYDFILEFIIIWIGMPLYGLGLLMNYLPFYIAKTLTANKIKKDEFKASVQANVSMLLWLPNYGIQLLIVALAFRSWTLLLVYSVLVPIMGYYVINYYPVMKKIFGRWRLLRLVRKDRKAVETLMTERADIIEELNEMKNIYLAADTKK